MINSIANKQLDMDRNKLKINISDHSLISTHFSFDRQAGRSIGREEEDNYHYKTDKSALEIYLGELERRIVGK